MRTRSAGEAAVCTFLFAAHVLGLSLPGIALPRAEAQTYEWTDAYGTVNRSDTLPAAGTFRELRVIEESARISALERRTLEIINREARTGSFTPESSRPARSPGHTPELTGQALSVAEPFSHAAENVNDPCLLSWDPACHEKHAADYDPRWGYAPSILRSPVEPRQDRTSAR